MSPQTGFGASAAANGGYTERMGAMGIQSPSQTPGPGDAGSSGDAGGGTGEKICPHCTFVNTGPASDCEICGLPLSG